MQKRPSFPWITDAAIPVIVAGAGVMGFNWPNYAGPILIAVGLLIFTIRFSLWVSTWPDDKKPSLGMMTPHDVIKYLDDESQWGKETRDWVKVVEEDGRIIEERKNGRLAAFTEFQKRAQEPGSAIVAYGLRNGHGAPETIPHSFWLTNWFSPLDTLCGHERQATAATIHRGGQVEIYTDVFVERSGVLSTWPRMKWRDRRRAAKKVREAEIDLERFFADVPPAPDYVPMKEASVWLYHNASPQLRKVLREGVPSPFDSIEEHGEALIREATKEGLGTLFGKWETGLPYERIKASDIELDAFESTFGVKRKVVSEAAVSRSDLDAILAHYEGSDRERERF